MNFKIFRIATLTCLLALLLGAAPVVSSTVSAEVFPASQGESQFTAAVPLETSLPATSPSASLQAAAGDTISASGAEQPPDPYFTKSGEEVSANEKAGQWLYRSPDLYVQIKRIFNKSKVQTYFVADIRFKETQRERAGFSRPKNPGKSGLKLYQIMRNYRAVIAVNGDYMHKVERNRKGIIIRDGKVYSTRKGADTLAFYPDGTMHIFKPGATTAKKLLAAGVKNTFSFGPTLINNGKIMPRLMRHRLRSRNPRTAVGMVEPYHYIFVVVDGRRSRYSKGMTLQELAEVFKSYNCTVAYNLDGGRSATMSFMGKNISRYAGSLTGQRRVPDALMFGYSRKVPKN